MDPLRYLRKATPKIEAANNSAKAPVIGRKQLSPPTAIIQEYIIES